MKKTAHIINSLEVGGAERMLQKLTSCSEFKAHGIFSLLGLGPIGTAIQSKKVFVRSLELNKKPWKFLQLLHYKPEMIVGWMYHSCLMASIYKLIFPKTKVIWNIRHSLHDFNKEKMMTRVIIKLLESLRFTADAVIFNSSVALEQHRFLIGDNARTAVIPNGFEPEKFSPLIKKEKSLVFGLFARFHPMKGHQFFLETFADVKHLFPQAEILFVGRGMDIENKELQKIINQAGLQGQVVLRGQQEDMVSEYNRIDILVIPSLWGEGFPNVLGEAMLMEKVCMVSDIGDSASILNNRDWVFRTGAKGELKENLIKLSKLSKDERERLGKQNRDHVISHYSLVAISRKFESFLKEL